MGYPNMLLPNTESHAITDPLIEDRYYAIVPISQDMTVGSTSNGTVTELMYTSDYTFSKLAGFELGTYEYEEGAEQRWSANATVTKYRPPLARLPQSLR